MKKSMIMEGKVMAGLYSIGHSTFSFADFAARLKKYHIDFVVDVRSTPYSKYAEIYNKGSIMQSLEREGIRYLHMGENFGARPDDRSLYNEEHYLDFEKVRNSDAFQRGVIRIINGLDQGFNIALMCTEKKPIDCHRAIMVSKGFLDQGVVVNHILDDGSVITQSELEQEMLKMYFPYRNQLSLFDADMRTEEEYIQECYRLRNADIGYNYGERIAL